MDDMGGARLNSAPPPNPASATQAGKADQWTKIPQRDGVGIDVPAWPDIFGEASEKQYEMWEQLWLYQPQAIVWERERMHMLVGTYVIAVLDYAEAPKKSAEKGGLIARLADQILMTPAALRSARIVVAGSADAAAVDSASAALAKRRSSRSGRAGLTVVVAEDEA